MCSIWFLERCAYFMNHDYSLLFLYHFGAEILIFVFFSWRDFQQSAKWYVLCVWVTESVKLIIFLMTIDTKWVMGIQYTWKNKQFTMPKLWIFHFVVDRQSKHAYRKYLIDAHMILARTCIHRIKDFEYHFK